ncbi:hypothetical protein [Aneurinibacillus aneurinilyticus]|uniref:hypothetical protein n=1 Tax=Aneurinibacillus aneurinilyticus TaxID=1391 RepID=UPI0023F4A0AE|nr:hypothetical protein [Aneurinibacillus aneurinilyticus]
MMIVRINGTTLAMNSAVPIYTEDVPTPSFQINTKLKRLALTLWSFSGILLTGGHASAAGMDSVLKVWNAFSPFFGTVQGFAMVTGTIGILAGLIILGFKRHFGKMTIFTSGIIIIGTALVPAMVLLIFFLGTIMNDAIAEAISGLSATPAAGVRK